MKFKKEILDEDYKQWDKEWETQFGPTDEVKIMSAEETLKELRTMANFKCSKEKNNANNKNKSI